MYSNIESFVQGELTALDDANRGEEEPPEIAFTVKLPHSDMAMLENLAAYFGGKKTPFASVLLSAAIEEALSTLVDQEEKRGNGEQVRAHLGQRWELEDGSGTAQRRGFATREQVSRLLDRDGS
jgi:hypothetical protein